MDSSPGWDTVEEALASFDGYLRRVVGVCAATRANYARYVEMFLRQLCADAQVRPGGFTAGEVTAFVAGLSGRYQPRTVEMAATALRSFFRFVRLEGLDEDGRLGEVVPMVPRRSGTLVRHLRTQDFEALLSSLEVSTPRLVRDRAMILCVARLGMRSSEVAALRLEDIDWDNATVRVRTRKTGHAVVLPLTGQVGAAIATYLQQARPQCLTRELFVLQRLRVGAPISDSIVKRAVEHALDRAGIAAPVRGANLLRHSLATELLERGSGLAEIADVMGHASLETTRVYAAVDLGALRQVPLPWPQPQAAS